MFVNLKNRLNLFWVERKLRIDLKEAKSSSNWKIVQIINLKLLWIDFIKRENEIVSRGWDQNLMLYRNIEIRKGEEIKLPEDFISTDPLQDKFAEKIVRDYGGVLAHPEIYKKYKDCLYKPALYLPYPKKYIDKACIFLCEQLCSDHSNWKRPKNADEIRSNVKSLHAHLNTFLEIEESNLPIDPTKNVKVGGNFVN